MTVSKVRKRDGSVVDFNKDKITTAIFKSAQSVGGSDREESARVADIAIRYINEKFADAYVPTVEEIQDLVEKALIEAGHATTAKSYIIYRHRKNVEREMKKALGVEDDLKLPLNSIQVLEKRYLMKDENGKTIETPSELFRRVARHLASNELNYGADEMMVKRYEDAFYRVMTSFEFLPNSPTLMNAGTELGQLSACFVLPVKDDIEQIFDSVKHQAIIHKTGGGTGFCFSYIRPKGDYVKSTAGIASGPISFMSAFDNATNVIKQGGKRRGANMATMHVWHPDIEEFVTMKQTPGVMENFNVSVMVDDKFMQAVDSNGDYELINPRNNQPIRKLNARSLFKLISYSAWKSAEPGLLFIDEINRHNPTPDEPIHATNPCIAKGAMVTTTEGLTEISKVHNPYHILTGDGNYHPVRWAGKTGEKDVYLVKTQAGYELTATADHKFLTEKGWKQADGLGKEDRLVLQKPGQFGKMHVDKEIASMLGWLTGDGHMSKDVQDVIFYFGTDEKEEMLPLFKGYLDRLNEVPVMPRSDGTETRLKYSSRIAKMFYELGMRPVKSHEKEVPSSVFSMDGDSVRNFLAALFGADGSAQGNRAKGVSIRLASNSLRLLKQVQVLLLQFGVLSAVHENRRKAHAKLLPDSARKIKSYQCRAQHELIISRASMFRFMEKIGFSVSAKNRKFHSLKPENVYSDNIDTSVASVEFVGKEEVFDLTEPETHSFSANGLIVHNCGEVPMPDYESCNLGSVNLVKFVELDWTKMDWKKKVDWNRLRYVVRLAIQFLDNVIDMNKYPIPQIKEHSMSNRRIGLGVMGFSRMLFKMGIRYDSPQGYEVGEQIMKFIQDEARKMSHELGRARGSFPNFKKSPLSSQYDAMRNATCTSIAPTGTISMIANSSSGIEPVFALSFLKTVRAGQYYYCDDVFEHVLKVRGLYSQELMQKIMETGTIQHMDEIPDDVKNVFRVAHDVPPEAHVMMQAAFQKNVDLAVSKTINLPAEATVEDVEAVYLQAWKLGCKGMTIYRDGSRSEQVLHIGKTVKTKGVEEDKFQMLQAQVAVAKK
ncbi:MAG: ribonucleotide reductase N-terminal alpha domain-containing protein [Candidatus ainarchaeum sp.]|nr:ribonucleotide reductase N-terminal alpha domain-containing protein [Candidatus ainarchaeum sp.]